MIPSRPPSPLRASHAYPGIGLPANIKWNQFDEFNKNTKEFRNSQRKAAKVAAAMKSGISIDDYLEREKKEKQQQRRPRSTARKKVRVKPKKAYQTYAELKSEDQVVVSGPTRLTLDILDEPPSSELALEAPSFKSRSHDHRCSKISSNSSSTVRSNGSNKVFVPGAARKAREDEIRQNMEAAQRKKGAKHTAAMAHNSAQAIRKAAMEKRMKMWEEHRKKALTNAKRKVQRTWFQKNVNLFMERVIRRRTIIFDEENEKFRSVNHSIRATGLTQGDLRSFKAAFDTYDTDRSGEISYVEFCLMMSSMLTTKNNLLTDYLTEVFEIYDLDRSGTLEFHEFVQMCTCYNMNKYADIVEFCFKSFDTDGSGYYTEDEFVELMKSICGEDPTFPGNFNDALRKFDGDGDGLISFKEFQVMCKRYPSVFQPAFNLQDRMQNAVLGRRRWQYFMRRRVKIEKTKEFMANHGEEHPPLNCSELLYMNITGKNPYHVLMPDVPWDSNEIARVHALKGALKPEHMQIDLEA
jgi:Ca2+-binding EF-hand superfamily protein